MLLNPVNHMNLHNSSNLHNSLGRQSAHSTKSLQSTDSHSQLHTQSILLTQPTPLTQSTTLAQPTTLAQSTTLVQPTTLAQPTTLVQPTSLMQSATLTQPMSPAQSTPLTHPSHLNKSHLQLAFNKSHTQEPHGNRHHQHSVTSLSLRCSGCGQVGALGGQQEVWSVGGAFWHPGCLMCAHCHLPFNSSNRVISINGKMYCRDDFEKLFGVLCDKCHNVIEPSAGYFNTGSKQFHTTCLSCTICTKTLSANTFFIRNDTLLCEQHKNYTPSILVHSAPILQEPPPPTPSTQSLHMLAHTEAPHMQVKAPVAHIPHQKPPTTHFF
eukprot:Phypoly_transcript_01097.p2 GENE.Phypoly_transcript_01097~~Phypoly_transcript_01097.p2  ORF type:complete len:324 (+),score=76.76 Phypoly_transcript_01097:2150-3121(+)